MRSSAQKTLLILCLSCTPAFAGGPLLVGGPAVGSRPALGIDGKPFKWNSGTMPIAYRVDPGPMASSPTGGPVISNAAGVQRVRAMTEIWQAVPTATISFSSAGHLLPAGSYTGGDLVSASQFNAVIGSCNAGTQSPIIFDANARILAELGLPAQVIGFATFCRLDTTAGHIMSAAVLMNGKFQDGINSEFSFTPNFELTAGEFDEAITHEIGHFLGLDHAQINGHVLNEGLPCDVDSLAGLPLMFPLAACQARANAGLPMLSPDDVAAISSLYPNSSNPTSHGKISGVIFFPDGVSHLQGVNVIARIMNDPTTSEDESLRIAVSSVSGFLFTGNPGQSVTASIPGATDNSNGSASGSRRPQLIGYYEILVPPGTYTVEMEPISPFFLLGSSIGPLSRPGFGSFEFWSADESAFDHPRQRDTIRVDAGDNITGVDIIMNGETPRFDQHEDGGALHDLAPPFVITIPGEPRG